MMKNKSKFIFGPVPSRRLGRSLGIDLVPFKTCTYDCIYCQLGCTTNKTVERKEYVCVEEVLEELRNIPDSIDADYITLSGSGEPTLNSGISKLITGIKKISQIPIAILTNSSLLSEKRIRDEIKEADLVVPSLDAGDERTFRKVNRPHDSLKFETMVDGLIRFGREFSGRLWLEIMFVDGINSSMAEAKKLIPFIEKINPDRIQLNTPIRPPAEKTACQVPGEELEEIKKILGPKAELIVRYERMYEGIHSSENEILSMLQRRPCSLHDLASVTGLHRNEIIKYITVLKEKGLITEIQRENETYFTAEDNM